MTKHATKIGHALSKALAGRNRLGDSLQAVLTAASQYSSHMVDAVAQEKELENLPETPMDASEVISPAARSKKRTPIGANGWENGFKLIRGSYWIRIQRRGKRKCVNLRTNSIRVARERREELSKLLVDGTYFGAKVPVTVGGLWERYAKVAPVRISNSTFEGYRSVWELHIIPFIGDMFCTDITNEVVEQLLADYLGLYRDSDREKEVDASKEATSHRKNRKTDPEPEAEDEEIRPERGNRLLQALKVVFYWGLESKIIDLMPFTNAKVPVQEVVRPYISIREISKFVEVSMEHSDDAEARELQVLMGIFLGPRSKEIRFTKGENFDWEKHTFFPLRTKTKKTREVPIPSFLEKKLKDYIQSRNIGADDYLFTQVGSNRPVGAGFLRHAVHMAGEAINKPALTPHRMRNTFATLHAIAGTPIRVIQNMLGHKCIQTTLLYIQDVPELNQIAQARLEALVGYGDLAGVGKASLQPWHEDIGVLLGNLVPVAATEPMLAAGPLTEIMTTLKAQLQRVEATLASLQTPPQT